MERSVLIPGLDFHKPDGAMLGFITASFSVGAVVVLPFIPWFNDKYGRKPSIVFGSIITVIGIILQAATINSMRQAPVI